MPICQIPTPHKDNTVNLALDTISKRKQALVFVSSKRSAEKQAEDISKKIKVSLPAHKELAKKALNTLPKPTRQCERLALCLTKGIAFHHAGLHSKQKTIIEDAFKQGVVRIICCTPTLAAGVDLPAYRAIVRDLKRYSGRFGMQYIPVLEYLQMVGRAGRPSYDDHGQGIIIAKTKGEAKEIRDRYVFGDPESIYSKLAVEPVLRTYVLSLVSTGVVRTKDELLSFFEKTFWAHQYKDMDQLKAKIEKTIKQLTDWEFLLTAEGGESSEFISANEVLDNSVKATRLGKRVAELYIDPLTARKFTIGLRRASTQINEKSNGVNEFSFVNLISNTLEMRPLLRIKQKEWDTIQEESLRWQPYLLENEPSVYDPDFEDFLEGLKTSLMFNEWMSEKSDNELLEMFDIRPGETRVKIGRAEWLLTALVELSHVIDLKQLIKHINKAKLRIKHGIKEELLPLIKLKGIGRVRARRLFKNNLKTLADLRKAQKMTIEQVVGKMTAQSIKEQLEKNTKPVPKGKRVGQLSMNKY